MLWLAEVSGRVFSAGVTVTVPPVISGNVTLIMTIQRVQVSLMIRTIAAMTAIAEKIWECLVFIAKSRTKKFTLPAHSIAIVLRIKLVHISSIF